MTGVVGRAEGTVTGRRRRASGEGRLPIWFGPVFGLFGIVFFVLGIAIVRDEVRLASEGRETDAVVTALQIERGTGDSSDTYWLAYRAATDVGSVVGRGQVSAGQFARASVGDVVRVTYLPTDPAKSRLGRAQFQPFPSLMVVGFGAGALILAAAMTWTAIRQRRRPVVAATPVSPSALGSSPGEVYRFTRSPVRVAVDLILAPLGATAFLGVAAVLYSSSAGDLGGILAAFGFAFFGLVMASGAVVTIRRGVRMTILEVGPDWIWLPELGRLPWSEVADVRLEDGLGGGGSRRRSTGYQRLGVVPRDPQLAARAPGGLARGLGRAFFGLVRIMGGGTRTPDITRMAPFGVSEYELEQPMADVMTVVGRYGRVRDARADPVAEPAGLGTAMAPAPTVAPANLGPDLSELLASSGTPFIAPALAPTTLVGVSTASTPRAAGLGPAQAQRTAVTSVFRRRDEILPGAIADVGRAGSFVIFPLLGCSVFVLVGAGDGIGGFLAFGIFPLAIAAIFVVTGVPALLESLGRVQVARGAPDVLRVGPDGLWLAGAGELSWPEIAEVRVGDADLVESEGTRPDRPRLEVVPRDPAKLADRPWAARARDAFLERRRRFTPGGDRSPRPGAFALDLDLLDADPDDVIDLIATYRVVDED